MRETRNSVMGALLACAALGLAACEPGSGLSPSALLERVGGAEASDSSPEVPAPRPASSSATSLVEGEAMRIYYQFVDERGRVRFVESLEAVPAQWRERVGYVESQSPPPMSPEDMRRAMEIRYARMRNTASQSETAARKAPLVVMYSADWCPACRKAKKFMDTQGIAYEERNVDDPSIAQELAKKSGGRGIPVFDIGGSILRGFSPQALTETIEAAS